MDLRRIRHFHVLAETLNVSRAAERLHLAQPALSVSIQKLEAELGTRLFDRTPSGMILTESGRAVLVEARRLLFHGEQLLRTARDHASGAGGCLRVGFVGSAIYSLIPSLIPAFRERYPQARLELHETTSAAALQRLSEEALDVALVRTPVLQTPPAALLPLQHDRFVAALPPGHALAANARLRLADLAGEPFVMYAASSVAGLRAAAMAACEAEGFMPQVSQEATQIATVLALVRSGLGLALVPESVSAHGDPHVQYRALAGSGEAQYTTLALAWQEGRESPLLARFLEVARALFPHAG